MRNNVTGLVAGTQITRLGLSRCRDANHGAKARAKMTVIKGIELGDRTIQIEGVATSQLVTQLSGEVMKVNGRPTFHQGKVASRYYADRAPCWPMPTRDGTGAFGLTP